MHILQIVHRDIKPQNILYSPTFKKLIFIDFGCAEVLNNKLGQLTFTNFQGTMNFSTE
jgi:serine/threonine protein kinase